MGEEKEEEEEEEEEKKKEKAKKNQCGELPRVKFLLGFFNFLKFYFDPNFLKILQ